MRNRGLPLAVLIVTALITALIVATLRGTPDTKKWLIDYGALLSAAIAAAVTAVYVVITQQHLQVAQQMYRYQFGAGTRVELVQEELELPPEFRVREAYSYPGEYIRNALPHRQNEDLTSDERVQTTLIYEIIRVHNERDNPIHQLTIEVVLRHSGCRKRSFIYHHAHSIPGKAILDIGVWTVENMPNYILKVSGDYQDAVGKFKLTPVEVTRDEQYIQ